MIHLILSAALAPLLVSADAPLVAPMQVSYRGTVETRADEPLMPRKAFDLTLWITEQSPRGATIFWLLDERGRGEFPWSEHFGRVGVDARWRTAAAGPVLLYDRGEGRSVVGIPLPFLAPEAPLAAGGSFRDDKLEFQVEKSTKVAEQPAWQVSVRDSFGPKRTLWVDQRSPLVLALTERVIVGRGEEFQLKLELIGSEPIAGDQLTALAKTIDKLVALRGKLNQPAQSQEVDWKSEQLALLREQLPALAELAAPTPLSKLVTSAQRDLELQSGRSAAVAELSSKFGGRAVEEFSIKGLGSDSLSLADLQGRVTVLHFWDYRDEPLKEPYGQVGYLDFMYHRRKPGGLQVYGVAVDGRLADENTRGAAERGVRKLKSFMNLSYPVLLDSGALVKQFGDPRLLGASLPLFVVVGPDQKIIHYHVGHYEVHQDQGLKELDQVVLKALEKK
ncbi:MAG: TlpA family protein disulfide reductase [Planctomycetia bacterium]|nr:TlpA family protein disulfide reductase [Planctomycetia bacterium]